jgi:hypothetical protein
MEPGPATLAKPAEANCRTRGAARDHDNCANMLPKPAKRRHNLRIRARLLGVINDRSQRVIEV